MRHGPCTRCDRRRLVLTDEATGAYRLRFHYADTLYEPGGRVRAGTVVCPGSGQEVDPMLVQPV